MLTASLLAGEPSLAAARSGLVQGTEAAEADDFFVVKRRDIYDAAPPEPAAAAPDAGLCCLQCFVLLLQCSQASASGHFLDC